MMTWQYFTDLRYINLQTGYYEINNMIMANERGQNTHSKGERVKIPLLPYTVDKRVG